MLVLLDPALGGAACAALHAFLRSPLHDLYLAVVFTRSAALRMPAQRSALLTVAYAKSCEQVLRRRGGGQVREPATIVLVLCLYPLDPSSEVRARTNALTRSALAGTQVGEPRISTLIALDNDRIIRSASRASAASRPPLRSIRARTT